VTKRTHIALRPPLERSMKDYNATLTIHDQESLLEQFAQPPNQQLTRGARGLQVRDQAHSLGRVSKWLAPAWPAVGPADEHPFIHTERLRHCVHVHPSRGAAPDHVGLGGLDLRGTHTRMVES